MRMGAKVEHVTLWTQVYKWNWFGLIKLVQKEGVIINLKLTLVYFT